ncbi:MAG TPA: peptide-methionine (R)-S-oxide reductase MsrB [Fimbriimonas sp.]|nr:peptide-methionine (R)-S-oxide reductase MsrB [Fimbriimonas sp.]
MIIAAALLLGQAVTSPGIATTSPVRKDKVVLTDIEWRGKLTREQYLILRAKGTEPAFCGVNLEHKGEGQYHCVGCDLALFEAKTKYDSGTGWPSFYNPIDTKNIWFKVDRSHNMVRTEVLCAKCDGHLGHVFNDGPKPSGLRYCMNGKVLRFVKAK